MTRRYRLCACVSTDLFAGTKPSRTSFQQAKNSLEKSRVQRFVEVQPA